MYSPISSAFRRFSMLSLTFISWPARVWRTNHWVCMALDPDFGQNFHELERQTIDKDRKQAQQQRRNHDHHGRTLEFVQRRPSALLQLFARFTDVRGKAPQVALLPEKDKHAADHQDPDAKFNVFVHNKLTQFGGGGGIRTPGELSPTAVFKTAA